MASKTLVNHYARLIRLWPRDPVRSVTLYEGLRQRLDKRLLRPVQRPQDNVDANAAQASLPPKLDEEAELDQVNALYSLLEDRYSKTYKTSEELLRPASNPLHYDNHLKELQDAPSRSWLRRQWLRWSRLVRFS